MAVLALMPSTSTCVHANQDTRTPTVKLVSDVLMFFGLHDIVSMHYLVGVFGCRHLICRFINLLFCLRYLLLLFPLALMVISLLLC